MRWKNRGRRREGDDQQKSRCRKESSYSIPQVVAAATVCLCVYSENGKEIIWRNYMSFHSLMITAQVDNLGLCLDKSKKRQASFNIHAD